MKRKERLLRIFIFLLMILYLIFNSCKYTVFAVKQTTSTDINSINTVKYPGIKEKIENLKKIYPNWNFKILYTGLDWNEVIAKEYTGHCSSPKNLVPDSSSYSGEWICSYCGDRVYDSGSWKCASSKAIEYMMDPRASINSSDIFQFLELSYNENGYSKNVIKKMVEGTFLNYESYINIIFDSSKQYNVNPYYIVSRIIQEQGKSGSVLVKGNGYNDQYIGYYNVFNIGAYGSSKEKVILNGLAKAKNYGWTSLEYSLSEGIKIIANNYISRGQNTLYFQKFDVENSDGSLYSHQYMQNILAAQTEGSTLRKTFTNLNSINDAYTFIIPVYENMPKNTVSRPSITSASSNTIDTTGMELVRVNANPSIRMRNEPAGSKVVGYLYYNDIVTRIEKASNKINGTYWDKVIDSNGIIGYVARCTYDNESTYKEYLVSLNNNNNNENLDTSKNQINNDNTNKDDSSKTNDGIKGDSNNDGIRDSADLLYLKKYLLNKVKLTNIQKKTCDTNNDGLIDSADLLNIKKFLLGKIKL